MKRRRKLLLYSFSVIFCFLFSFLLANKVDAFSYVCIDSFTNEECVEGETDYETAYYKLLSVEESDFEDIEVDGQSVKVLNIPSFISVPYDENNSYEVPVAVIGDGVNSLIENNGSYKLHRLVLPSNVAVISSKSLQGFSYIGNIDIPKSTQDIQDNLFHPSAIVENVYFVAYAFSNDLNDFIEINDEAFAQGVVNNVICENHEVYEYYRTQFVNLKYNNLLTKITYHFYRSELDTEPFEDKSYYVGVNTLVSSDDLCDEVPSVGLTFVGWNVKKDTSYNNVVVGGKFHFLARTTDYNVYPKYILNPVENVKVTYVDELSQLQEVTSLSVVLDYNGFTRTLGVSYDPHVVATQEVHWYKDNEEVVPEIYGIYNAGVYKYEIISTYWYQGIQYTSRYDGIIQVIINKKNLVINTLPLTKTYGERLKASDCLYTIENLLSIHTQVETRCIYNQSMELDEEEGLLVDVGNYSQALVVRVVSVSSTEGNNELDNYEITYHASNYKVQQKQIIVAYTQQVQYIYGSTIDIYNIYQDSETGDSIKINYSKQAGYDVGEYAIVSAQSENPNYYAVLSYEECSKIEIVAKGINVLSYMDDGVYNGKAKNLSLYYIDVMTHTLIDFEYKLFKDDQPVDEIINAGSYSAKIVEFSNKNYFIINHSDLSTDPYVYNFSVLKAAPQFKMAEYQKVTYTGAQTWPHALVNNSEQTVKYACLQGNAIDPNGCVKAGTHVVRVSVEESENYIARDGGLIQFVIASRTLYLAPKEFKFYYNEPIVIRELINVETASGIEQVEIVYRTDATQGSLPGKYPITNAYVKIPNTNNDNINFVAAIVRQECQEKVEIVPRPIEIVYFDYTDLVYDGRVKEIGARVVDPANNYAIIRDVDLTVVCDEGEIKNAKTYHLRTYIDDVRYVISKSNLLEFTVAKATYDLSGVKFENKIAMLDFKKHSISLSGKLPEGVEVIYTIDGEEGNATAKAFKHNVVATFVGDSLNYHAIEQMEATIYIDMSWMFITFAMLVLIAGMCACLIFLNIRYRRVHPRKIKLKIRNIVNEDLQAKRDATSIQEVLGDKGNAHADEEHVENELLESEDDLDDDVNATNFIDRIYAASSELKKYYSEVKNELLAYEGVMHTVDRKYELFYHGPRQIAKLSICNNVLRLYVNLAPEKYDKDQYKHRDMSKFECHARTPLRLDVNTQEGLRHAKVFIRILRKKENLKASTEFARIDYEKFYTLKENVFPKLFKKMFNKKSK